MNNYKVFKIMWIVLGIFAFMLVLFHAVKENPIGMLLFTAHSIICFMNYIMVVYDEKINRIESDFINLVDAVEGLTEIVEKHNDWIESMNNIINEYEEKEND